MSATGHTTRKPLESAQATWLAALVRSLAQTNEELRAEIRQLKGLPPAPSHRSDEEKV